jgi:hypothetical protein
VTATLALRPARASDAELICLIYNQGIEDRVATLETELRSPAERREWMAARWPRHSVIVAESDGSVVGWGSLNVFNARPAYQHVADFSVYVERKCPLGIYGKRSQWLRLCQVTGVRGRIAGGCWGVAKPRQMNISGLSPSGRLRIAPAAARLKDVTRPAPSSSEWAASSMVWAAVPMST